MTGMILFTNHFVFAGAEINQRKIPLLTLTDVLYMPEKYDGKRIIINCIYFETFECTVLGSEIFVHDTGYHWLKNGDVWAIWRMDRPVKILKKSLKKISGGNFPILYGEVQVDGIFHKKQGVGHLGEYNYAFEIYGIRISDNTYGDSDWN